MMTDKEIKLLVRRIRRFADKMHGRGQEQFANGMRDAAQTLEQGIGVPKERNRK